MIGRRWLILVLAVGAWAAAAPASAEPLRVVFFISSSCEHCQKVKRHLPQIVAKWPGRVVVEEMNLSEDLDLYAVQTRYEDAYGAKVSVPPAVFVGDRALVGADAILDSLSAAIEEALAGGTATFKPGRAPPAEDPVLSRFRNLSVGTIIGAGLIDGINPCAFTTIIFFLSMLSYLRTSKRDMILVGVGFTAAVFVTYLALGFGLLLAVKAAAVSHGSSRIIGLVVAALVFVLAGWSVWDVVRYQRTGDVRSMKLGLPKGIKQRIHKVIREGLTSRRLFIGSVVVGFVVAVLESICTGQTYLPIVYVIQKVPDLRASAIPYLLLYNLMFILPLVVILFLGYKGVTSERLGEFMANHLVAMKLAMAGLFTALGIVVLLMVWVMR